MYEGKADEQDYQYVIDRLEHQATLYRVSPWGLKFYFTYYQPIKQTIAIYYNISMFL